MGGVDLGARVEAPFARVRPFAGMAIGVHGTFEAEGGDRYFGPSTQVLGGVQVALMNRLALRTEARFRLDQLQGGSTANNTELTAGITWSRR
jgi:hypothetical protein